MKKVDVVKQFSAFTGKDIDESEKSVNTLLDIIKDAMINGEILSLRGLGTFKPMTSKKTTARDIMNNKLVDITPKKTVRFKLSGNLKKAMNED